MSDLEGLRADLHSVQGEVAGVKTDVELVKRDVAELKRNEADAKIARGKIHNKLDRILEAVNQRIGADRIRARFKRWSWESVKLFAAAAIGWLVKMLSGS